MGIGAKAVQPRSSLPLQRLKLGCILDAFPDQLALADLSIDDLLLLVSTDEVAPPAILA